MKIAVHKAPHNATAFRYLYVAYGSDQEEAYSNVRAKVAIELEAYWLSYSRISCVVDE